MSAKKNMFIFPEAERTSEMVKLIEVASNHVHKIHFEKSLLTSQVNLSMVSVSVWLTLYTCFLLHDLLLFFSFCLFFPLFFPCY